MEDFFLSLHICIFNLKQIFFKLKISHICLGLSHWLIGIVRKKIVFLRNVLLEGVGLGVSVNKVEFLCINSNKNSEWYTVGYVPLIQDFFDMKHTSTYILTPFILRLLTIKVLIYSMCPASFCWFSFTQHNRLFRGFLKVVSKSISYKKIISVYRVTLSYFWFHLCNIFLNFHLLLVIPTTAVSFTYCSWLQL